MPPIETDELNQSAVLWPIDGYDEYGKPRVSSEYEQIQVRWEWVDRETPNPFGNPLNLDANVVVDQVIAEGSKMWLGEFDDYDTDALDNRVMEVVRYHETPDLKGRHIRRVVGLRRYQGTLPETT